MPETPNLEARIAALDAQVMALLRDLGNLDRLFTSIRDSADIEQKVAVLEAEVTVIKSKMEKKVDYLDFSPVKMIVYGLTAILLVSVMSTILLAIGLHK